MIDSALKVGRGRAYLTLGLLVSSAVLGCTATPDPGGQGSPTEMQDSRPLSTSATGFSVVQEEFAFTELSGEEREELEELEAAYLSAADRRGWTREEISLIETYAPDLETVGAYLLRREPGGEQSQWLLHWVISPAGGNLELVPEHNGEAAIWDRGCRRFVYAEEGNPPAFTFDPAVEEVVPLIHGIPWVGFSRSDLRYIDEALGWLSENVPHRLEFIQSQCIPRVLFSEAGRYLAAATASSVNIVFDREGLRIPGFSPPAQQVWFASVLYHESVHIQQFHQRKTCGLETEAYAAQNDFLQEVRSRVPASARDDIQFIIDHGNEYLGSHVEVCD